MRILEEENKRLRGEDKQNMTHNHNVGLNCKNLEKLVEMLQTQLNDAQNKLEQLLSHKKEAEKNGKKCRLFAKRLGRQ